MLVFFPSCLIPVAAYEIMMTWRLKLFRLLRCVQDPCVSFWHLIRLSKMVRGLGGCVGHDSDSLAARRRFCVAGSSDVYCTVCVCVSVEAAGLAS